MSAEFSADLPRVDGIYAPEIRDDLLLAIEDGEGGAIVGSALELRPNVWMSSTCDAE